MTSTTCKLSDCNRNVLARGMCSRHYQKWRKDNADQVRTTARRTDTLAERVAMHSHPAPGGCIVWTGYMNEGLPWLGIEGKGVNVRRAMLTQRTPVPQEGRWFAAPRCNTENCVSPDHLEWSRVSRPTEYAVSDEDADALVAAYKDGSLNVAKEARRLGVSRPTIYRAMERRGFTEHQA